MTQKVYILDGRQFRTEADYRRALHDKEIIDPLRESLPGRSRSELEQLRADIRAGKYQFLTLLGQDFADELDELIRNGGAGTAGRGKAGKKKAGKEEPGKGKVGKKEVGKQQAGKQQAGAGKGKSGKPAGDASLDAVVQEELIRQEKRRKLLIAVCAAVAAVCLGYFGIYSYYNYRTGRTYENLSGLKEQPAQQISSDGGPTIHYTSEENAIEAVVLEEYKNLLIKNKKLIGWVKIDDTNIDYPVMQTSDNEYYLDHNLSQEYDKNGSIFMDKDCDVLRPSTNFILYGHHMKSGQMFGGLDKYEDPSYCEEHPYIRFDTIYEKGTWQVMYVFRSRVYSEEEIVFKYYQFIDALSEQEFDSYMQEMAEMSLYDTGVTAQYGDRLLTLSTCDYQEENGRFVVVAKKIA